MQASQLKHLYSSYTPIDQVSSREYENYFWFETDQGKIGLSKKEVTSKEYIFLLELFPKAEPAEASREEQWRRLLFHKEHPAFVPSPGIYRFIFFEADHQTEDQDTLREALQALFPYQVPVLWKNSREGVLIEEYKGKEESSISLREVMDVLMSDFYMKIRCYVSEFFHDFSAVHEQFAFSRRMADIAGTYVPGTFATQTDAAFYLYMDGVEEGHKDLLSSYVLGQAKQDADLLDTVKAFLENGTNASATAKELYMHRNSLQYRIDKFIEGSGMDIRDFRVGLLVYLSILHVRP